jgi:hypothetical protein
MRCTQFVGLPKESVKFLQDNIAMRPHRYCPHCDKPTSEEACMDIYESAASDGMFDDGPVLHAYTLKDGRVVREVVQATPWSSGPCIFLKLMDGDKDLFVWTEEEINKA